MVTSPTAQLQPAYAVRLPSLRRCMPHMLALGAVTASLVCVMLCILHCHLITGSSEPGPPVMVVYEGQPLFICHTAPHQHGPAPSPLDYQTMRALSQFAPAKAMFVPTLLMVIAVLPGMRLQRPALAVVTPDPPPPRLDIQ
ncbi:MAG: hypothetical protein HC876_09690 [Chloroflexaceae bacterium]|nr:hypothetical protein [Chloroflexaceae bacterium]NJO05759.1 hypothetical protein [Chloroflexaceae bacterium]